MGFSLCLQMEEADELDTFVELELHDPEKADVELQRTSVIMNEDNPRWGEKFDFVMVSATSTLDLTVYDKQGFFDNLLSVKALTGKLSNQGGQHLGGLCQTCPGLSTESLASESVVIPQAAACLNTAKHRFQLLLGRMLIRGVSHCPACRVT